MTSAVFFCVLFSSIFVVTKSQTQPHSWDFRNCPSNGGYSDLQSVTDTAFGPPVNAQIFGDLGCGPEGETFVEQTNSNLSFCSLAHPTLTQLQGSTSMGRLPMYVLNHGTSEVLNFLLRYTSSMTASISTLASLNLETGMIVLTALSHCLNPLLTEASVGRLICGVRCTL